MYGPPVTIADVIYTVAYLNGSALDDLECFVSKGERICNKKTSLLKVVCLKNILTTQFNILCKFNIRIYEHYQQKMIICKNQINLAIEWHI